MHGLLYKETQDTLTDTMTRLQFEFWMDLYGFTVDFLISELNFWT